ncbi:MAG: hypothetical protein ACYCY5_09835 [Sulfuricella sp.]
MKNKPSNVVPIFKYVQTNDDFVDHLSQFIREQSVTLTSAAEPLVGAFVVLYGKDSIKRVRLKLTP